MNRNRFASLLFLAFVVLPTMLFSQAKAIDSLPYYQNLYQSSRENDSLLQAYRYFSKLQVESQQQENNLYEALAYSHIALLQYKIGFLNDSEQAAVKALQLLDKESEATDFVRKNRISLYNHLGKIYREYGDFQKALSYYELALSKQQNPKKAITIWNNIGFTYFEKGAYQKAVNYFQQSLTKSQAIGDARQEARALDNLGMAQAKLGLATALPNLQKALALRQQLQWESGILTSYLHIADVYLEQKRFTEADKILQKALAIAVDHENLMEKEAVLRKMTQLSPNASFQELMRIQDSLQSINKATKNKYAALKYEKTKEQQRADRLALASEKEKQKRITYQSTGIIILIISIFTVILLKSVYRKKTLQQVFKTETRISKKVHDEVANDLYKIMIQLQDDEKQEAILDDLDKVYAKTRDISRENSDLEVDEDFSQTLQDLFLDFQTDSVSIIVKGLSKIDWKNTASLTKITLYRVLQELLVNMKKHSEASFVVLKFDQLQQKIRVDYQDNGKGCVLKKHNGLRNAENRIDAIKGSISFASEINHGFSAKIQV